MLARLDGATGHLALNYKTGTIFSFLNTPKTPLFVKRNSLFLKSQVKYTALDEKRNPGKSTPTKGLSRELSSLTISPSKSEAVEMPRAGRATCVNKAGSERGLLPHMKTDPSGGWHAGLAGFATTLYPGQEEYHLMLIKR